MIVLIVGVCIAWCMILVTRLQFSSVQVIVQFSSGHSSVQFSSVQFSSGHSSVQFSSVQFSSGHSSVQFRS